MKLYTIPRGSKIYLNPGNTLIMADGSVLKDDEIYIHFGHLDGAYSYCTIIKTNDDVVEEEDDKGDIHTAVLHLSASTELTKHKDGYMLKPEEDLE